MSFRRRIAIVSAAAVAIAVVLASLLIYALTSSQLHGQIDSQLRVRGDGAKPLVHLLRSEAGALSSHKSDVPALAITTVKALGAAVGLPGRGGASRTGTERGVPSDLAAVLGKLPPPRPDQVRGYQQLVDSHGTIVARSASVSLPVDAATRALATHGGKQQYFRDARVGGVHIRILAESLGDGHVLQLGEPLTEVDSLLNKLRLILALIALGGIALAALLGRFVAGTAIRPLRRLTETTEHVTATRDLSSRIAPSGGDEIGRLASSFNAMLDALERSMHALDASVDAQRQLVADASHELRTPVTSLRTNIEILQQQGQSIDAGERERLLSDVVEQIEELTALVNDLIDLARGDEPRTDTEDVRLDALVQEVAERTRRRASGTPLQLELEPTLLAGVPARLERAVGNLIDNAIKYSPSGSPVEVTLRGQELAVSDHGPGISAEDLPHVFDRFYRGAEARGRPGSGLGLAIVRQVAVQHGGSVLVETAPGGGTRMRVRFPNAERVDAGASEDRAFIYDPASV